MIYLKLFLEFLKIGAFTFGGGYAMIPIIREAVLSNGWMTEDELLSFIAVAESTPGPIAVNMATFVGSSQGGFLGALLATLGVVLPSFAIILLIASLIKGFLKYRGVEAFLKGVRPTVVAMILATALTIGISTLFSVNTVWDAPSPDLGALIILAFLVGIHILCSEIKGKKPSPMIMILISAGLGILLYS